MVHLENCKWEGRLSRIESHRVDIGIVPKNPEREGIEFIPLVEEKLVFIASKVLLEKIHQMGWKELEKQRVIGFGRRCIYQTCASEVLQPVGISNQEIAEFSSVEMIKQTVRSGLGIALVPEIAVKKELQTGELMILPLPTPESMQHGLIFRKGREISAAARVFKQAIIGHLQRCT
jgi:LysR family transcriptional regulator, cell division regulator